MESESSLMRAVAGGDEEAFTLLFRRYHRAIFHFVCRLTGSVETAEELTQECFVRMLRSAGRFNADRGSLRVYLYAAARNLVIRDLQKSAAEQRKRLMAVPVGSREAVLDDDAVVEMADRALGPEELVLMLEASEVVKRAVWRLPMAQREALVLVEYEDLSLEEAARVLEIDVGAVKSRVHRARERLKTLLAPYFGCSPRLRGKEAL